MWKIHAYSKCDSQFALKTITEPLRIALLSWTMHFFDAASIATQWQSINLLSSSAEWMRGSSHIKNHSLMCWLHTNTLTSLWSQANRCEFSILHFILSPIFLANRIQNYGDVPGLAENIISHHLALTCPQYPLSSEIILQEWKWLISKL